MGEVLLPVDDLVAVQGLQGEHNLCAEELGPVWVGGYWSSERVSLAASRLKSSPPGQYSSRK